MSTTRSLPIVRLLTPLLAVAVLLPAAASAGVCVPLSPASDNVRSFGVDYRPRLDVRHAEDAAACSSPLPAEGDVVFVLRAWNLGTGITGAALRLVADAPIAEFTPAGGFAVAGDPEAVETDGVWVLDLQLAGPLACGPLDLGEVAVTPDAGEAGVFAVVDGFGGVGLPGVLDADGADVAAVSPRHGAYAGAADLYHCQPPLCAEPLAPVTDLTPVQSGGAVIELGWTAGDGDFTMIRYRDDGRPPTSIHDGEQLVLFPANEGAWQTVIHSDPEVPLYHYAAFNVRMAGDQVDLGSQLECGSFAVGEVDPAVSHESTSWGELKSRYR